MPNPECTHITIILDRSGSMASIRDDAIGGFNTCIQEQRKLPGAVTLTLVQFDHEYELVHHGIALDAVPPMTTKSFVPRGSTALYDAIGRAVVETMEHVGRLPQAAPAAKVVVAILTDGAENASQVYDHRRIRELIRERTATGWEFLFLGANVDVEHVAAHIGLAAGTAIAFDANPMGTMGAFGRMSERISASRGSFDPGETKKPN